MFLVPLANPATTTTLTGLSAKKRLTLVTKDSGLVSQLQSLIQEIPDSPYHKKRLGVWKLSVFRPERKNDSGEFIPLAL